MLHDHLDLISWALQKVSNFSPQVCFWWLKGHKFHTLGGFRFPAICIGNKATTKIPPPICGDGHELVKRFHMIMGSMGLVSLPCNMYPIRSTSFVGKIYHTWILWSWKFQGAPNPLCPFCPKGIAGLIWIDSEEESVPVGSNGKKCLKWMTF